MAFPQIFQIKRDAGGAWLSDGLPVSNNMYSVTLNGSDPSDFTLPSTVANWMVRFTNIFTAEVWMSANGEAASAPGSNTVSATNSTMLQPGKVYYIPAGTPISLFSAASTDVGIELYAINEI